MKTSRKAMEWLFCFSILNLMFGCLLFKKIKKFNESCLLSKAARMSSTYLETRRLENVIFIQTILSFVLSRKIMLLLYLF